MAYGCSSEGVWDVEEAEHELERCVACCGSQDID